MQTLFDYNNISEEQKEAVKEVCRLCDEKGYDKLSSEFKTLFSIVEREKYDVTQNAFFIKCQEVGIHISYQGFMIENNVEYPMVAVTGDMRDLEKLINNPKRDREL